MHDVQAQSQETVMFTLFAAYPFVFDMPEGIQRLVDEHSRRHLLPL